MEASLSVIPQVRAISFFLPQFHPIPENDQWWGKGFTEWTNVTRAKQNFLGHHQPQLPAGLGFYDLRVPETRIEQAELARQYGIHGFCYYYYWFAGNRLLYRPLEDMLTSRQPDFPFCICWANENWTRTWDGAATEILIKQEHSPEDSRNFIRSLMPFFFDRRYIRINDALLLIIYRVDLLPNIRATVELWREECRKVGVGELHLSAVQSFGIGDPRPYGFDSAIEFPPHGTDFIGWNSNSAYQDRMLNSKFRGYIVDIQHVIDMSLRREIPEYKLFRGVMPSWDNTARRQDNGLILVNSSPERYEAWLARIVAQTRERFLGDERLLFINAWNEWAEGCHLEPDQKYGHSFLEATHRAVCGLTDMVELESSLAYPLELSVDGQDSLPVPVVQPSPNEADQWTGGTNEPTGVSLSWRNRLRGIASWWYQRLPFPPDFKRKLFSFFVSNFRFLFRGTPTYEFWLTHYCTRPLEQHSDVAPLPQGTAEEARQIYFTDVVAPKVSVIIPVYNNISYTLNCLRSIQRNLPCTPFEIIVINDCSSDETASLLLLVNGLRVINNKTNLGFLHTCNKAAKQARGDYLLFLNNDTEVLTGWLDELVDTFSAHPDAGLVGSKLLYPDSRLQEAGGIIWQDASGMNYGHSCDPLHPDYSYLRDSDYCSGASIMVRRQLFEQLGGFDSRYAPAYYEDTDLAFAMRRAGWRVIYQPLSQIIHFEGVSSGTDINSGIKAYQVINQSKFLEKWREDLREHGENGQNIQVAKERRVQKRALIIDFKTPAPDQDSGSIDACYYIQMIHDLGYKVTFIPDNLTHTGHYTESLQRAGVECWYEPYIKTVNQHLEERGAQYDLVILCRVHFAAKYIDTTRRYCSGAKIVFNTVDLHYLREERQAQIEKSIDVAQQAKLTKDLEYSVMKRADATILISQSEYEILHQEWPELKIAVIPYVREVYGCAVQFFARRDILFIGSFLHAPNIDAVQYFVTSVWPLIRREMPEMNFYVIGSNIPAEISNLAQVAGIFVKGFVEDIAPIFNCCRLSVAPLRFGAGIKGKIGTSLSYGVPCVATVIAAEGMGLVNRRDIMIANDTEEFAAAVVEAYRDEALWNRLSKHGLEFMEQNFSYARGLERLGKLIDEISGSPGSTAKQLPEHDRGI